MVWKSRNVYLHWECLIVGRIEDLNSGLDSQLKRAQSQLSALIHWLLWRQLKGRSSLDAERPVTSFFSWTKARSHEGSALWSWCWSLLHADYPSRNTEAAMTCPTQWWRISLGKIHYKTLTEAPKHTQGKLSSTGNNYPPGSTVLSHWNVTSLQAEI